MYRTAKLPAGKYTVKALVNALQQDGGTATDQNVDFYVQSGSDIQKVNCYGDFTARELEIELPSAADVEIGIRAYAPATVNWVAQKNLRIITSSYNRSWNRSNQRRYTSDASRYGRRYARNDVSQ